MSRKYILVVTSSDGQTTPNDDRIETDWFQEKYRQVIGDLLSGTPTTHNVQCYVKIVVTKSAWKEVQSIQPRALHSWQVIDQSTVAPPSDDKEKNSSAQFREKSQKALSEVLHELADALPYTGASTTIIFDHYQANEGSHLECDVPLFGAVSRLKIWHNANVLFLKGEGYGQSATQESHPLFSLGTTVAKLEELHLSLSPWDGKIAVIDQVHDTGDVFPGFSLDGEMDNHRFQSLLKQKLGPEPRLLPDTKKNRASARRKEKDPIEQLCLPSPTHVCGRTIEVLHEMDLRTLPFFLLDSWTLRFTCRDEGSSIGLVNFINNLDLSEPGFRCLLARLRVYRHAHYILKCGETNLCTEAWKARIVNNYKKTQEPPEEQVAEDCEFMYFLLLPHLDQPVTVDESSQTSVSMGKPLVMARLLLSPHEISPAIIRLLESQRFSDEAQLGSTTRTDVDFNVPVLKFRNRLEEMLRLLQRCEKYCQLEQQDVMRKYEDCEGDGLEELEKEKVKDRYNDAQSRILHAAFRGCPPLDQYIKDNKWAESESIKWIPELALGVDGVSEKVALRAREASRNSLPSYASTGSNPLPSPLSLADLEKTKNSKDFDVADVLRFFNHDGSHNALPISPEKLKGRSICRVESIPDLKAQWPDSQTLQFHDIYYNKDEQAWRLERLYGKVRDKGLVDDTRSSFMSSAKKPKPLQKISPVRSSPRKRASTKLLMTRSRSDSLSSTTASQDENLFKQPSGRPSSPRRRTPSNPGNNLSACIKSTTGNTQSPTKRRNISPSELRNSGPLERRLSASSCGISSADFVTPLIRRSPRKKSTPSMTFAAEPSQSCNRLSLFQGNSQRSLKKGETSPTSAPPLTSPFDLPPVRKSPRKSSKMLFQTTGSSANQSPTETFTPRATQSGTDQKLSQEGDKTKLKRSDRHKMRLKRIIETTLAEKGVKQGDLIFDSCSKTLFDVSMVLLRTLKTSENLTEEMKNVVYTQVTQIINLEKRRCGLAV